MTALMFLFATIVYLALGAVLLVAVAYLVLA